MRRHVGFWPSHWGSLGFAFFPAWWLYLLLLYPTLYLARGLTWATPGRRWRDWIDEHVLLGGAIMPGDVAALKAEGVGAVISLCAEFQDPIDALRDAGIDHLDLPTLDRHPPHPEDLEAGVARIFENVDRGVKTYVHCASGVGRSATLVACYLVKRGKSPEEAIALLRRKRAGVSPRRSQRAALEAFSRNA